MTRSPPTSVPFMVSLPSKVLPSIPSWPPTLAPVRSTSLKVALSPMRRCWPTSVPFMVTVPSKVPPSMRSWPPILAPVRSTSRSVLTCCSETRRPSTEPLRMIASPSQEPSSESQPSMRRFIRLNAPWNRQFSNHNCRTSRACRRSIVSSNHAPFIRTPLNGVTRRKLSSMRTVARNACDSRRSSCPSSQPSGSLGSRSFP